jgi:thymidylate synthase (FAD)
MKVKLISLTHAKEWETPEHLIAFTARVSNPASDEEKAEMSAAQLLLYCIKHGHWSVFEMVDMTVKIQTSRAISAQILRHKSFSFQEFSQRYSCVSTVETYEARSQDDKNRQSSLDNLDYGVKEWFMETQHEHAAKSLALYKQAIGNGISKESARFLLPMSSTTKIYMKGSIRSWIHYLTLRTDKGTQKEHRDIAMEILKIFKENFPIITDALGW